jgi:lipopolysaccharide export system permease protein
MIVSARLLRRYLARRFLAMMLGAFIVCMTLIFMIDLLELLRQSRDARSLTIWRLMWIGLLRLPSFSELLLPFAVLTGSIGALLSFSRRSELAVMRAGGMSVWQFTRPGVTLAFVIGVLATVAYNPLASTAHSEAERLMAEAFGKEPSLAAYSGGGAWLRQNGVDGQSVLAATAVADAGSTMVNVIAIQYDHAGRFMERIDADRAILGDGHWVLQNAWVARVGREPEKFNTYSLSTYLDRERVRDALGSVNTVSIWELPGIIDMAEKAKLPAERFRVQYELLLARPLLLATMVLLAATVSLRSFRQGGIQTMVVTGMVGGIGFFLLTEVSRQIGLAGLVSARLSVWLPIMVGALAAITVLLHQEDG